MLRGYQNKAVDEIRTHYSRGFKKVLLHMATGGGKTVIFSHVLKTAAYRGNRCLMVVRGRKLVDQASQRLFREGVHHGVQMAGHWNFKPAAPIQVCSIDTLIARKLRPDADLIVIDEAHMATSEGYVKFLLQYPDAFILAVTATPFTDKPLRHVAEVVVKPITVKELVEQGFLVPARYFAPANPDLDGVKVSSSTKDYQQDDLATAMQKGTLVGDLVTHWEKLGQGRPTICFAVTVQHSRSIVEQFKYAGIKAEHCDADTPENERQAIIDRLVSGETKVISNVGIFCTGVDIPPLGCIIMARPTKSYNLYIQQAGRGTRTFEGKQDFILLDHSGNITRHGFIDEEREADLDGKEVAKPKSPKTCKECFCVFYGNACPACGSITAPDPNPREIIVTEGRLEELTRSPFEAAVLRDIQSLEKKRKLHGFKKGWVYFRLVEKYGEDVANKFIPKRVVPSWVNRGAHGVSERGPGEDLSSSEREMLEISKS